MTKTTKARKLQTYSETREKRWGAGIILAALSVLFLLSTGVAQGSKYPTMPPTVTTIYSIQQSDLGHYPVGGLVADSAGNLYGVTYTGGVFELPCSGTPCTYTSAPKWLATNVGLYPTGLTIDSRGNLYGATFYGGVYELLRSGTPGTYQPKQDIASGVGRGVVSPLVMDSACNLYGTVVESGLTSCSYTAYGRFDDEVERCGIVFELSPPANSSPSAPYTLQVLHSFTSSGQGGFAPVGGLTLGPFGDTLYGTTMMGGSGGVGTVFELSLSTGVLQVLHNFSGPDGATPIAGLVRDSSGNLYGTTSAGGSSWYGSGGYFGATGYGTVFELSPPARGETAYTEQVLYSFYEGDVGSSPGSRLLMDSGGHLYGTVYTEGPHGEGSVFKIDPSSGAMTILGAFASLGHWGDLFAPRDLKNAFPLSILGGVVMGPSGNLYGATFLGGSVSTTNPVGWGTVFEVPNPDGEAEVLITQVNALLTAQVINQGQDGSLVKELQDAIQMIDAGKLHGAIGNFESFITEVDDLENSGVLTSDQAAPLVSIANAAIEQLQALL